MTIRFHCNTKAKGAFDIFASDHKADICSYRARSPGSAGESSSRWVVNVEMKHHLVPHFDTFLISHLKEGQIRFLEYGDLELFTPTEEGLVRHRKAISERLRLK